MGGDLIGACSGRPGLSRRLRARMSRETGARGTTRADPGAADARLVVTRSMRCSGIAKERWRMSIALGSLAVLCGIWGVVAALLIAADLHGRGVPVSYVWLRVLILKYLGQYAKITQEETGRVGPLFYHYVVPLNVALVLCVILAIRGWS